jgi:lycopene beta-cyclase
MGEAAGGSKKNEAGRWITKSESGPISSKFVVDTRPIFGGLAGSPALWQTFVGVEIEFDEDTFDPSTAELMRFLPSRNEDVRFIYQLPESRRQGLFELTMLSIQRPTFEELKQQLTDELRNAFGGRNYRVIREEQGLIPMGIHYSGLSKDPSYVHVGVGAGSARPSTGYTFCRIQRWAKECARELGNGEPPIGPIDDTPLVRHMDTIFLQVLREHPQLAPEIFVRLFEKVPAARLLRFLGDSPSVIDAVSVVAALPKLPFLREVLAPKRKASPVANGVKCFR